MEVVLITYCRWTVSFVSKRMLMGYSRIAANSKRRIKENTQAIVESAIVEIFSHCFAFSWTHKDLCLVVKLQASSRTHSKSRRSWTGQRVATTCLKAWPWGIYLGPLITLKFIPAVITNANKQGHRSGRLILWTVLRDALPNRWTDKKKRGVWFDLALWSSS